MDLLDAPDPPARCVICGQELDGDPEDQPFPALGPMCGECYRSQQTDDEIDAAVLLDDDHDLGF
jgi:NMD protein affecting ribosome stability and mRNA decay